MTSGDEFLASAQLQLAMSAACLETKQRGDERINFLTGVVEGQRRPD